MRRAPGDADAFKARDDGRKAEPIDRRPLLFQLLDAVGVSRDRKRHFAGDDEVRQQGMALAHRYAVGGHDAAEQAEAAFLSQLTHQRTEPVAVVGLDTQLALPFGIEEIVIAFRKFVPFDQPRIVRADEHVEPRPGPLAMSGQRRRIEIAQCRRFYLLKQLLPMKRFHCSAARLENIRIEAAGTRLGHSALDDLFRACAPHPNLDAVFLLEGIAQNRHVLEVRRGINRDSAGFPCARNQLLSPVRPRIGRDLRAGRGRRLRECRPAWQRCKQACQRKQPLHLRIRKTHRNSPG